MKWYDWFAFTIWINFMVGDLTGIIFSCVLYFFYERNRKEENNES